MDATGVLPDATARGSGSVLHRWGLAADLLDGLGQGLVGGMEVDRRDQQATASGEPPG